MLVRLKAKIRDLYYRAVLFGKACPACGLPDLAMLRDSWCWCRHCGYELDPTEHFDACPDCRSGLKRRVYHYWCARCRRPVRSIYCFDAKVFDAAYFRKMMRHSRESKQQRRQQIRQMLAQSRSPALVMPDEPSLAAVPGLESDLNEFVNIPLSLATFIDASQRPRFEMCTYHRHILELASGCTVRFEGISRLIEDTRLDRIFRFITIIFMANNGEIEISQDHAGAIVLRGK